MDSEKCIIGFTGSFGSGCSHIIDQFFQSSDSGFGYESLSLSNYIKANIRSPYARKDLQDEGNRMRQEHGLSHLADLAIADIEKRSDVSKWVVNGIRNLAEIFAFRRKYPSFYLIGVFADEQIRWERVAENYGGDRSLFIIDDRRDRGEGTENGQQVEECFYNADLVIPNYKNFTEKGRAYTDFKSRLTDYVELLEHPYTREPDHKEALMSIAYAQSFLSSCLKRKVGAIIADEFGSIFSSGYNEVPRDNVPCSDAGECRKDKFKREVSREFDIDPKGKMWSKIKNLERCMAVHAEENAILNLARFGVSVALKGANMYTTTFPCNLCAKSIAQLGIKELHYFESYPQEESKRILEEAGVILSPFMGVTFHAFFKLYPRKDNTS